MQGAMGQGRAGVPEADLDALGQAIDGGATAPDGSPLLPALLAGLPFAVGISRVGPGFPLEAASERFQVWLLSLSAADSVGGAVAGEVTALVAAAAATGRPQQLEGLHVPTRRGGAAATAAAVWDVAAHPLRDRRGRVTHVLQLVTDVTEEVRGRERLAAASRLAEERGAELQELHVRLERMAALDKLKSDFMNLTTHELRSPLAIVYGYLCMMDSGVLGELSVEMQEAVKASVQSVELMMQLVTELVEMARLDESRVTESARDPVDLADVVTEAARRVLSSDGHQLRLEVGTEPVPVLGDRGQLLRVFSNIVDNAVKYSPRGGQVRVSLRRRGSRVTVDVTDQGVGIAAADMDRLFTRFGRIVSPANQGIAGTGLGLYLCREMVRRLGGEVTAASVEGKGSTFTVRLPVVAAAPRPLLGG
jgi:signal transduction histidine kinase